MKNQSKFIPALRYSRLTAIFDPMLSLTMPEKKFKQQLLQFAAIKSHEKILDFGVGTATLSIMGKQRNPEAHFYGIDIDPQVLAIAKEKAKRANSDLWLNVYNGKTLDFEDGFFDKIISSLVFHHLSSTVKKSILKELYRVLKPGGEMHLVDFGKGRNVYTKTAFSIFRRLDGEENTRVNAEGELPQYLVNAGFDTTVNPLYVNTLFGTMEFIKAKKPSLE